MNESRRLEMARIFVRERNRAGEGTGRPRFAVIGVEGTDLKIFKPKVRRKEIEQIAESVGAELVYLERTHENRGGREGSHRRRHH